MRDDEELLARLRAGDEEAFASLVERYSPAMLRVASAYVPSGAVAEEVVQETWLAAMRGLDRFEGRSSLRTWLFGILTNLAMKGRDRGAAGGTANRDRVARRRRLERRGGLRGARRLGRQPAGTRGNEGRKWLNA